MVSRVHGLGLAVAALAPIAAAAQPIAAPASPDRFSGGPLAEDEPVMAEADRWARPHFVEGDLNAFFARPTTRRDFVGVGAGVNALPKDASTILNAFYLTIEPQLDVASPRYTWKLGLSAPLQFELVDTRGAFELCIEEGRMALAAGGAQGEIMAATAACADRQQHRLTEHLGQLRRADWDEASDVARIVRYVTAGAPETPFYLAVSRHYDQTLGHGTVIRRYNPNLDYNTARLGAKLDVSRSALGFQMVANDLVRPDVVGLLTYVRPFRPYAGDFVARSLSLGFSFVRGGGQPLGLAYERGLFGAAYGEAIPRLDQGLDHVGATERNLNVVGADLEVKLLRTASADMKVYVDYQKMAGYGGGVTLGSLWRWSFGAPASQATRLRAELIRFDADYLPGYFDTFHDIFATQYLPLAYRGSNGLVYYPTKLEYLEAHHGRRKRLGGQFELSHAIFDVVTASATVRAWTPLGASAGDALPPAFPDRGAPCALPAAGGAPPCPNTIPLEREQRFTSLRLHVELPLRRYLQAFASYEVFTTTAEDSLGVLAFDGDNEIFLSGARVRLLPILFLLAEARRYYFLQRLSNVDLATLTLEQDQNYHSRWTFALSAIVGYEF